MSKSGIREVFIQPRHAGRTRATEIALIAEAATEEDARLAIADLHDKGYAILRGGKHFEAPMPAPPVVFFDEGPSESDAKVTPDTDDPTSEAK